jgi:hypothetical protein
MTEENLPAKWEDEMAGFAKESADMVKPEASSISLRGGIVSYGGTPVPGNTLDVVVLGFVFEHSYYDKDYDPDNVTSPACFSLGTDEDDMAPNEKSETPQHDTCAGCPNLEWGSSPRGRGKACQQRYRLIVVPADSIADEQSMLAAEVAVLKLPVTSGKYWNQYVNQVSGMFKRPEWGVITQISAEPDAKTQFKAIFNCLEGIDFEATPEVYGAIRQKIELSEPILYKAYDANVEEEPKKPARKSKARA